MFSVIRLRHHGCGLPHSGSSVLSPSVYFLHCFLFLQPLALLPHFSQSSSSRWFSPWLDYEHRGTQEQVLALPGPWCIYRHRWCLHLPYGGKSLTLTRWWCAEATVASEAVLLRVSRLTAGRGFGMTASSIGFHSPSLDTGGSAACLSGGVGVEL